MADPQEDPSMHFFGFSGQMLATRDIAMAMANMIFAEVYGDHEAKAQLPLNVSDDDDRWTITGSKAYEGARDGWPQITEGPVVIEIVKRNCAVIRLVQLASVEEQ